jgi:histidinol-phosphatase (PHP family)
MRKNFCDSHVHSNNSHDGRDPVDAVCREAIRHGLSGIAVTDHCDIDAGRAGCLSVLASLTRDIRAARTLYGDRLRISLGVELGEVHHDLPLSREIANDPAVDFVIGSLHRLRNERDFYYLDYDRIDLDALLDRYYDELLEMAEVGDFDVVAHIDYQVRYMSENARLKVDFSSHFDRLVPVLKKVAGLGRGIEINTSSGRRTGEIVPRAEVLRAFREVGGEIITIGSDAHTADRVGHRMEEAMAALRGAGFTRYAFFERRKPVFFDL